MDCSASTAANLLKKDSAPVEARRTRGATTLFVVLGAVPKAGAAKTLVDYFQPVHVISRLTSTGWGAPNVQPRDQDNGLEDKTGRTYSYWELLRS